MSGVRINCPKELNRETGRTLLEEVRERITRDTERVVLDFSQTESMNTFGAAWIVQLGQFIKTHEAEFDHEGLVRFDELTKLHYPGRAKR
ncbi:MAG: hypothetical protein R6V12_17950, partial [Candidatus Hydrogenedentota bacterium]